MSVDDLEELLDVGRTGRAELIARIRNLVTIVRRERLDARQLNENLTATQTRCTELLLEARELRAKLESGGMNMSMTRMWMVLASVAPLFGCGFHETVDHGVPNLGLVDRDRPSLWRMGQPPDEAAWRWVQTVGLPGTRIVVVKLNDDAEGRDDAAVSMGMIVDKKPLPPEDDKPWTVLVKPDPRAVREILDLVTDELAHGSVVVIHCTHGRDRTSLISALLGMRLWGWSKSRAWRDMLAHGFRWELPDLDAYWLEDVP